MATNNDDQFQPQTIRFVDAPARFLNVWEPTKLKSDATSKPRYSANVLLDPDNPKHMDALDQLDAQTTAIIQFYFGKQFNKDAPPRGVEFEFVKWGDDCVNDKGEVWAGYKGKWVVSAYSPEKNAKGESMQPALLSARKGPDGKYLPLENKDPSLYDGSHIVMSANVYRSANYPKRISLFLRAVMALGYGERIGGGANKQRDFDDFNADDYSNFDAGDEAPAPTSRASRRGVATSL